MRREEGLTERAKDDERECVAEEELKDATDEHEQTTEEEEHGTSGVLARSRVAFTDMLTSLQRHCLQNLAIPRGRSIMATRREGSQGEHFGH